MSLIQICEKEQYPVTKANTTVIQFQLPSPVNYLECTRKIVNSVKYTGLFSFDHWLEIALCNMRTLLVMQKISQTGDDLIFAIGQV